MLGEKSVDIHPKMSTWNLSSPRTQPKTPDHNLSWASEEGNCCPVAYSHTATTTQVFGGHLREDAQGKAKTIVHMLTCPRSQGWRSQEKDLNTSNPVGYVPVPLLAPTSCPRSIPHRALSPEVRSLRAKPELLRPEERTSGLLGKSPLLKASPAFPEWYLHILECCTVRTFWWLFG